MKLEHKGVRCRAISPTGGELPLLVNHVAERTGLPDRTIRYYAKIDRLHGFKLGKKIWGFWRVDVERYLGERDES